MGEWPTLELVRFSASEVERFGRSDTGSLEELVAPGVPKKLFSYAAADHLFLVETRSVSLVGFGNAGPFVHMCVDLVSGHVVDFADVPDAEPIFVNASLALFTWCVAAVVERFPFYDVSADTAVWDQAASEIRDLVRSIDPPAVEPDRFWSTLADDAAIGDLATEIVVGDV